MLETALLSTDFLVYSAHKTGTQTISHTLRMNGLRCIHCHLIGDETTRIPAGEFRSVLRRYAHWTGKRLRIISVFRLPVERHISSFFQWYGEGVLRKKVIATKSETIIMQLSVPQLQAKFVEHLRARDLPGIGESIDEMCAELQLPASGLTFDPEKGHGVTDLPFCRVALFRFEKLIRGGELTSQLPIITGKDLVQHDANVTNDKWYRDIYEEFRETLRLPSDLLTAVYESRRHLFDLFYPGQYPALLAEALHKFCDSGTR